MPFDHALTAHAFQDSRQSYGVRETMLYALGLGVELLGWRPDDLPRGV